MFKYLIATIFTMFAFNNSASAASYASVTWSIAGVPGTKEITMDVDLTTRFVAFNGLFITTTNDAAPISGTCFQLLEKTMNCNFMLFSGVMIILELQLSTLNGSIKLYNDSNTVMNSGVATLTSVK